ncbi:MAG: hypothetical protein K2Y18_05370 [Alphaproteobacteria bacterium]|nr:hypothetical protein [Alphaproteobacteria bacterium]
MDGDESYFVGTRKGKIVGDGTHADLLVNCPLYKSIWVVQIGGFLADEGNHE